MIREKLLGTMSRGDAWKALRAEHFDSLAATHARVKKTRVGQLERPECQTTSAKETRSSAGVPNGPVEGSKHHYAELVRLAAPLLATQTISERGS